MFPLTSLVFYQDLSGATVTAGKDTHLLERPRRGWGQTSPRSQQSSECSTQGVGVPLGTGSPEEKLWGHRDLLGL